MAGPRESITTAMMIGGAVAHGRTEADQRVWLALDVCVFRPLGAGLGGGFYLWFRDDPAEHPGTNLAERITHQGAEGDPTRKSGADDLASRTQPIPWDRVFRQQECLAPERDHDHDVGRLYADDVLVSDLPARGPWRERRSVELALGHGPCGRCGRLLFRGLAHGFLVADDGQPRWGRTAQSVVGAGLAASGLLASMFTGKTVLSSILVAIACFGLQLQLPAWWASGTQISGKHLGALMGLMNMIGNGGGAVLQTSSATSSKSMKSRGYTGRARWDLAFSIYVVVALLGHGLVEPGRSRDGRPQRRERASGRRRLSRASTAAALGARLLQ